MAHSGIEASGGRSLEDVRAFIPVWTNRLEFSDANHRPQKRVWPWLVRPGRRGSYPSGVGCAGPGFRCASGPPGWPGEEGQDRRRDNNGREDGGQVNPECSAVVHGHTDAQQRRGQEHDDGSIL